MLNWEGGAKPLLVIRRRLFSGFSFAYVPWGPELPEGFPALGEEGRDARTCALAELAAALHRFLPRDTAFIRFDPPWYSQGTESSPLIGKPFSRAGADVQPPDTVLLDLRSPPERILAAMKPKWRYNVGLAARKGVTVRQSDPVPGEGFNADIGTFYRLLRETASRDGIAIHGIEYYRTFFSHAREYGAAVSRGPKPEARLYLAEYRGETLAAIVTLFHGREGVYLYGASANSHRNLMAPYALQWKAMGDAKAAGCAEYDLFGIPPNGDEKDHSMAGLYRFKTGFIGGGEAGGRIIHRPGSWDYTYRPLISGLFNTAERVRKKLRSFKKKRLG
ncbi:MAG: peptidoglycan bridge formation glycyltransferase FemA/FemB family protein [Treponema sp.]|nr:peptidoglycan bridge formation glycyltransferase FemA/FemB family protein [Treponema sp.]